MSYQNDMLWFMLSFTEEKQIFSMLKELRVHAFTTTVTLAK